MLCFFIEDKNGFICHMCGQRQATRDCRVCSKPVINPWDDQATIDEVCPPVETATAGEDDPQQEQPTRKKAGCSRCPQVSLDGLPKRTANK